jgi:hypothetical protein
MATAPRAPQPPRPSDEPEPDWQPIDRLPLIASVIDGMLAADREQHATLLEARPAPHLLDDATIARVKRVFREQRDDLWLYAEQLARWERLDLPARQRREVARLTGQLARVRELVAAILALADELAPLTIDRLLAMDDAELGLATLLGLIPLPGPPTRRPPFPARPRGRERVPRPERSASLPSGSLRSGLPALPGGVVTLFSGRRRTEGGRPAGWPSAASPPPPDVGGVPGAPPAGALAPEGGAARPRGPVRGVWGEDGPCRPARPAGRRGRGPGTLTA